MAILEVAVEYGLNWPLKGVRTESWTAGRSGLVEWEG